MTKPRKIRVMVVEDSAVIRELLCHIIAEHPQLEVAASVGSGEEALRLLENISPDVISLDIRLPGIDGFETTCRVMSRKPTPIVVVSASVESEDLNISMNALRAGALAVVEKPVGVTHSDYAAIAGRLCTQLVIMSSVKLVRQRLVRPGAPRSFAQAPAPAGPYTLLAIAASTGGPNALVTLFEGLGRDFPLPILLVQHITASFLEDFVSWLDGMGPLKAVVARDGERPQPGVVHVAPAERHLVLKAGLMRLQSDPPVSYQRPSGTVLLESLASELGPRALGLLLTGMGDDGARGLLAMRAAGSYTLAEDESTAVVYGMPGEAAKLGAVSELLPLGELAPRILELLSFQKVPL